MIVTVLSRICGFGSKFLFFGICRNNRFVVPRDSAKTKANSCSIYVNRSCSNLLCILSGGTAVFVHPGCKRTDGRPVLSSPSSVLRPPSTALPGHPGSPPESREQKDENIGFALTNDRTPNIVLISSLTRLDSSFFRSTTEPAVN